MLGKVCEDRKTYTSMCDVVQDFWDGINGAELALGRPQLPKLKVEPGEGDDSGAAPKARVRKAAASQGPSLQLRSGTMSTDVDDASFLERGFKADAVIEQSSKKGKGEGHEPTAKFRITSIVGQDVTVKSIVGQDAATTMKRCQIVDCYTVVDTSAKAKAARFRVRVRVRVMV